MVLHRINEEIIKIQTDHKAVMCTDLQHPDISTTVKIVLQKISLYTLSFHLLIELY